MMKFEYFFAFNKLFSIGFNIWINEKDTTFKHKPSMIRKMTKKEKRNYKQLDKYQKSSYFRYLFFEKIYQFSRKMRVWCNG